MKSEKKIPGRRPHLSLRLEFTMTVMLSTVVILLTNLFLFFNINAMIGELGDVYNSNLTLNEMAAELDLVQNSMTEYLNTKSTDSMEDYYRYKQDLKSMVGELNSTTSANQVLLAEKNISNLTESYLEWTDLAIDAKRGRNIVKYKTYYENATDIHGYVSDYITSLNNDCFQENAQSYSALTGTLQSMEVHGIIIFLLAALISIALASMICSKITVPLKRLAQAAQQVSGGNYEVELSPEMRDDEVGVLNTAFYTMVGSIQEHIVRLRENMELERRMKEKELMMETHLKDARLKYLQAQINPHFLFNTLNAGAQLAMMEGADRAYEYIQQVASFYRYNIRKDNDVVALRDEINLVDTYVYILNVRFSGDIGYLKTIEDDALLETKVPGMILQPIVENSVNYGIRNIDWAGQIEIEVYREDGYVCVSIRDNGAGMTQERIQEVLERRLEPGRQENDSNGIGLDNVMGRLELMYPDAKPLVIMSEGPGKGTEVILYIPEEKENV